MFSRIKDIYAAWSILVLLAKSAVKVMLRISRGVPKVVMSELFIALLQKLNE